MTKVLFINPNTDTFGRQSIPLVLLSAMLKERGHSVRLFDTTFFDMTQFLGEKQTHETLNVKFNFFKPVNYSHLDIKKESVDVARELEKVVADYQPDFIAFSFWGSHLHGEGEFYAYFFGLRLIEKAHLGQVPIFVGGTVPTWNTEGVLAHPKIAGVVRGEGELAFCDIADRIAEGRSLSGTKNLWLKTPRGGIEKNELRPLIDPLDQLPYPDFSIYDDRTFWRPFHGKMVRCVDYELSRGCVHNCTFCLSPFQRGVYGFPKNFRREKSVEKIIAEISYLKERYNLDMIRYQDETFLNMKADKLKKLAELYRKKVGLPFVIEATIPSITEDKLRSLKKMQCLSISLGLESGSPRIRTDVIHKPHFSNEKALEVLRLIKEAGISCNVFNIIGFPTETLEDIMQTIFLNYKANPPYCMVSFFQPWEGTALRELAVERGELAANCQGLDNSLDNLMPSKMQYSSISKDDITFLHDTFMYHVYINKIFWPLFSLLKKKNIFSGCLLKILNWYMSLRFLLIK